MLIVCNQLASIETTEKKWRPKCGCTKIDNRAKHNNNMNVHMSIIYIVNSVNNLIYKTYKSCISESVVVVVVVVVIVDYN